MCQLKHYSMDYLVMIMLHDGYTVINAGCYTNNTKLQNVFNNGFKDLWNL